MAEYITVDKAYLDRKVYEDFQENKDEKPEDIRKYQYKVLIFDKT